MATLDHTIAPVSLAAQATDPDTFARDFGRSFERYGFAVVTDHGLDSALVQRAWALTAEFFARPEEEKRAYAGVRGGARGYTPFGVEIAKGAQRHDLKEFWHVGRTLEPGHRFEGAMPPNVWPDAPEDFRETMSALYDALDGVGRSLLSAIALRLDLPADWFDPAVREGNSILRLLHYPPVGADAPGIRAGAHEDINLITLLLGAEEAGLEILTRENEWLPIDPPADALVVNVGDMLQRLTNHVLPSTTHRVRNPAPERRGRSRYSMPFFLHPAPDFVIETLPGTITPDRPNRYPEPISSDEFLKERLREIGLLK